MINKLKFIYHFTAEIHFSACKLKNVLFVRKCEFEEKTAKIAGIYIFALCKNVERTGLLKVNLYGIS